MDRFDEMVKAKAKGEAVDVPVGFGERIDDMTEKLTKDKGRKKRKASLVALVAVVTLMISTSVIAFATPIGVQMTEGAISYFNAPKEFKYLSKQAAFEKYNAEVGIDCEDNGIRITLDSLAVDDNYIHVFYTLSSEEPIRLLGDEETPLKWRQQMSAVNFWFKADGKYIEPAAQGEMDAYSVDEYTMKGMQRFALVDQLGDNFDLEIYTNHIWHKEGQWHMAVNVDKSSVAAESKTVMPNLKAKMTSGWGDQTKSHDITVKKVSVSPFGAQIVLSEKGENTLHNFVIRDDRGRYLTVIPAATSGSRWFKVDNSFEFIAEDKDIKSVTLVPILSDGHSESVAVDLAALPIRLPVNDYGAYVLEQFETDAEKMVAVVRQDGAVPIINLEITPTDANGELLRFATHVDYTYDRETGKITLTYYWGKDVTEEDLSRIAGLSYFSNYDFQLNEKEAVTVNLK